MQKKVAVLTLSCALALSSAAMADGELSGVSMLVYVEPTTAPFAFLESDFSKPLGFDVDVINELQRRLGFSYQEDRIFPLLRSDQFERMRGGEADIIAGGMSASDDRAEFMDFTPVYFDTGLVVMHSKTHTPEIKGLDDLDGKIVLVSANSTAEAYVKKNLPNAQAKSLVNLDMGFFEVAYGQADAIIYDYPICKYFADTMPALNLETVGELFAREESQYVIGLRKDSPYNRYIIGEMNEMLQDGTLEQIRRRWGRISSAQRINNTRN